MEKIDEKKLCEQFLAAKEKKRQCEKAYDEAQTEFLKAEQKIIESLQAQDKTATATFEGLGYASLCEPQVRASYREEDKDRLFEFLKSEGRADLIKEAVNAKSLSGFVREMLKAPPEKFREVPEFVRYYLQTTVRLYSESGKWLA